LLAMRANTLETPRKKHMLMLRFVDSSKSTQEVPVTMPRSLPELLHTAAQMFGHGGALRLYHRGSTLLYHASQMSQLRDGDLVVVRRTASYRPVTPAITPRVLSTHQADFQKRSFQAPALSAAPDYESTLTDDMRKLRGVPIEGMSRYASDFVIHPISARQPTLKQTATLGFDDKSPMATSSYGREFFWQEPPHTIAAQAKKESSNILLASPTSRFDGRSSYTSDFTRSEPVSPRELIQPVQLAKLPEIAFAAVSTYGCDFKMTGSSKQLLSGRQPSARPKRAEMPNQPFVGTSEYRGEFHEEAIADREWSMTDRW